jgi:hypothetical protein
MYIHTYIQIHTGGTWRTWQRICICCTLHFQCSYCSYISQNCFNQKSSETHISNILTVLGAVSVCIYNIYLYIIHTEIAMIFICLFAPPSIKNFLENQPCIHSPHTWNSLGAIKPQPNRTPVQIYLLYDLFLI